MKPIVVADVGGTHARIAIVERANELALVEVTATRTIGSANDWLDEFAARHGITDASVCIAVAGPVSAGVGMLTNGTLSFDETSLSRRFGDALIVNDFTAAAMGVPITPDNALHRLGDARPGAGTKAIIGPGTGLGMGILLRDASGWRALPSEGGHGDLVATNPLEHEIHQLLSRERPFVSWESVLSGPGLISLYRAVCAVWGCEPENYGPQDVTRLAHDASDPVCHQTVELFCGFLGGAAGSLAITVCAEGGVYLCGGMMAALLPMLRGSAFRRRFEARGALTDYMRPMATVAVLSAELGLIGAAAAYRAHRAAIDPA